MVDHITPIKEDWSLRLDLCNLQSLCHCCHNKKTAEEVSRRG
ncbi:HNH endonuclease [Chengkuizengella sp. SCS-71B]